MNISYSDLNLKHNPRRRDWTEEDIKRNEKTTTLTANLHGLSCPACESKRYTKSGKAKGNQRYKCKKCGKHFRSTTGNTIHHLHLKPKIEAYISCMNQGFSLRKTAEKLEISLNTAFRWRHRFLSAMKKETSNEETKAQTVSAYVLPFSSKGKPYNKPKRPNVTSIFRIDITGNVSAQVVGQFGDQAGKLTSSDTYAYLPAKPMPQQFKTSAQKCRVEELKEMTESAQSKATEWLAKFRGVASKYLGNYWAWFSLIQRFETRHSHETHYMYSCF